MLSHRAYSLLEIKSVDSDRRIITGTATSPSPDRLGDVVEPLGVSFRNPLPLLLHHDSKLPVGTVSFKKPTASGIEFEAQLPLVDEPPSLKDRVDTAWGSVKAGLIRGVSIGFRSLEDSLIKGSNGIRFIKTEVLELSLVTVPANSDCTIATLKSFDSFDTELPAASGTGRFGVVRSLPGATGLRRTGSSQMKQTITDQIASFEATRAAKSARMSEIMSTAGETGVTLDQEQEQEYDGLDTEVKSIDSHLTRLAALEKANKAAAKPVNGETPTAASESRGGGAVVQVKSVLPKGTAFVRYAMATAAGKGDFFRTLEHAKQWHDTTPEVELMVKAAIAAGTTTDATWAGPLAVAQPLVNEFLELLRPRTLIGRIPGLRHVPFNVSVPSQTAGGTYGWVGQGAAKPVTKATFGTVSVPFSKAAGIIVLTEELVKLSSPSAEATVREEMIAGMAQFLDGQFIDPAVAVSANVSPASITNGATTFAASGTTGAAARVDLAQMIAAASAAEIPLEGSVLLMSETTAFALGLALNALGQPLFAGVGINGGSIMGIPIIVSNIVGARVILVHAPSILFADEGGTRIDVSREASVQMDSAPDNPATATTVLVSLWQNNLVGLRVERMITWIRARAAAVRYISGVAYVA